MNRVYLSLGSNLGNRRANLKNACEKISTYGRVVAASTIIETKPMYVVDQPEFCNQVIAIDTALHPIQLLERMQAIETDMGRVRSVRYGPRTIDIDILYYGNEIVEMAHLNIPHPLISEREFVLAPLAEIAPLLICPKHKLTIVQMLAKFR